MSTMRQAVSSAMGQAMVSLSGPDSGNDNPTAWIDFTGSHLTLVPSTYGQTVEIDFVGSWIANE